jgi:hypothetical protein
LREEQAQDQEQPPLVRLLPELQFLAFRELETQVNLSAISSALLKQEPVLWAVEENFGQMTEAELQSSFKLQALSMKKDLLAQLSQPSTIQPTEEPQAAATLGARLKSYDPLDSNLARQG